MCYPKGRNCLRKQLVRNFILRNLFLRISPKSAISLQKCRPWICCLKLIVCIPGTKFRFYWISSIYNNNSHKIICWSRHPWKLILGKKKSSANNFFLKVFSICSAGALFNSLQSENFFPRANGKQSWQTRGMVSFSLVILLLLLLLLLFCVS